MIAEAELRRVMEQIIEAGEAPDWRDNKEQAIGEMTGLARYVLGQLDFDAALSAIRSDIDELAQDIARIEDDNAGYDKAIEDQRVIRGTWV